MTRRETEPEGGEVESLVVVGFGLASTGVAGAEGARAAAAATVAGGYVEERGGERRIVFEGIGIREGKAEEFGMGRSEERRRCGVVVKEFEGDGGDASHGTRTLPYSRFFNYGAYLLS